MHFPQKQETQNRQAIIKRAQIKRRTQFKNINGILTKQLPFAWKNSKSHNGDHMMESVETSATKENTGRPISAAFPSSKILGTPSESFSYRSWSNSAFVRSENRRGSPENRRKSARGDVFATRSRRNDWAQMADGDRVSARFQYFNFSFSGFRCWHCYLFDLQCIVVDCVNFLDKFILCKKCVCVLKMTFENYIDCCVIIMNNFYLYVYINFYIQIIIMNNSWYNKNKCLK